MYSVTLFLSCITLLASLLICGGGPRFLDRTIKGDTTLTQEWMEITPETPLKPERDVQAVMLYLAKPYEADLEMKGVRIPDGSLVKPEVQLVDTAGKTYSLNYYGLFGRQLVIFTLRDQLMGREYRTVRIRSDKPIHCKQIFWRLYYTKDID
ncbi:MAG TPA: hypothetical protein VE980_02650 [Pyrinomonadaceae bacterium]|nr:hypothetical protein [Pyrinomonadaceae bacterium]